MGKVHEYVCPCCGGGIEFNTELQKVSCPYCGTEFEMDILMQYDDVLKNDGEDSLEWNGDDMPEWMEGEEGSRLYECKYCGGQIIGDETLAASKCPYCDNPIVMMGQLKGELKPEYIIPFQLNKDAAKKIFSDKLVKKKLLPKSFRDDHRISEIKGLYVPYWLYDSTADVNLRYKGTRTNSWSDAKYIYTKTSYYSIRRAGTIQFAKVPQDGSKKMADDMMETIEPYDYNGLKEFQTAYFAGYMADRYDVTKEEGAVRVNERVRNSSQKAFAETVTGYHSLTLEQSSIRLLDGKISYAMLPVWILTATWNDQQYIFTVNGQTGKFSGDLPIDKKEATKQYIMTFTVTAVLVFLACLLKWLLLG